MLDKIKPVFYHSGLGIALCGLALFLIGNTLYLNTVRDKKAESLEAVEEAIDLYQASLEHQNKGTPGSLKPFINRFRYGVFLNTALKALEKSPNLGFTGIRLESEEPRETVSTDAQTFPFSSTSKKKKAERIEVLTLSGEVKNLPQGGDGPYQQLNEMIAQIEGDTHCQWVLTQAGEATTNHEASKAPGNIQFALTLRPKAQPECWQHYTQPESSL